MGKIGLQNIKIHAHIGVSEEERLIGRTLLIDIEVEYDLKASGKSDSIMNTLNYETLMLIVDSQAKRKFHLLEALARNIASELIKIHPEIIDISIKIQKNRPFIKGEVGTSFIEWRYSEDY